MEVQKLLQIYSPKITVSARKRPSSRIWPIVKNCQTLWSLGTFSMDGRNRSETKTPSQLQPQRIRKYFSRLTWARGGGPQLRTTSYLARWPHRVETLVTRSQTSTRLAWRDITKQQTLRTQFSKSGSWNHTCSAGLWWTKIRAHRELVLLVQTVMSLAIPS